MQITLAHVVVQELSNMSPNAAAAVYLRMGYTHVLPLGFDHILFILSLLLLSTRLKPLLWQATAFTVAHSLSLALAMYNIVNVPSSVIEPLISFSICLVALENIFFPKLRPSRIVIVFIFGLVHGLGFAEALTSIGLSKSNYLFALLFFNVGVELAQVTVIVVGYFY
ncbi:MAG: HupE/UreJ family protein [Bacteroidota bacterium]